MNTTPHRLPTPLSPVHYGCGEYPAWISHEAHQQAREERQEREDRVCPFDGLVPAGVSADMVPTPWAGERLERVAVAGELIEQGLRGSELDGAIDLTMFARRFVRWAEDGFPMGN